MPLMSAPFRDDALLLHGGLAPGFATTLEDADSETGEVAGAVHGQGHILGIPHWRQSVCAHCRDRPAVFPPGHRRVGRDFVAPSTQILAPAAA